MLEEDSSNVNLLNLKICQDVQHQDMVIAQQAGQQHALHVVVVAIVATIPTLPTHRLIPRQGAVEAAAVVVAEVAEA